MQKTSKFAKVSLNKVFKPFCHSASPVILPSQCSGDKLLSFYTCSLFLKEGIYTSKSRKTEGLYSMHVPSTHFRAVPLIPKWRNTLGYYIHFSDKKSNMHFGLIYLHVVRPNFTPVYVCVCTLNPYLTKDIGP